MKTDKKLTPKNKKQGTSTTQKKVIDSSDTSVSVFTRTTNPKVIIRSENVKDEYQRKGNINKHKLLKFLCLIIMCLVILMTFFLALKTYNAVNELSEYFTP